MRRAVVGVGAEPRVDAAGFALQFLDALGFFGAQGGLGFVGAVCAVGLTMALEQGLHGGFQLVGLVMKSARVPLRCLLALEGSLTPSMANISRPIRPCASHTSSTCLKTWPIRSPRPLMKAAMRVVVKWGQLSPLRAMKMTWSPYFQQAKRSMPRLEITPRQVVNRAGQQHHFEQHGG